MIEKEEQVTGNKPVAWKPAVRPATPADLPAIRRIQTASPEGAQWEPWAYLRHQCVVATAGDEVCGFLAWRTVAGEHEILNLAVAPERRRLGVAQFLLRETLTGLDGKVFLEVRTSNQAAQSLYEKAGFTRVGVREDYYSHPPEPAIVMALQSC